MCGFIVLPPRHPLASQALHHFRSTKSGISRETQVVQHTDHLIKLSKFKNVIPSALQIIDRLLYNFILHYYCILLHLNICLISHLTSSIKVCCFEVTEDFRILFTLLISSHPTQVRKIMDKIAENCLIRRARVFHQHTKVRGVRRPTFTSRLSFWISMTYNSFRKIYESCPKKYRLDMFGSAISSYRSFGNISPFCKNGFAVETLAGQRSIAPIVFSAQRSTSRVQTGLTGIHGSTDYLH